MLESRISDFFAKCRYNRISQYKDIRDFQSSILSKKSTGTLLGTCDLRKV